MENSTNIHHVLDHGFVRIIDTMGGDSAVVQAARVSYGSGTKTPSSDERLINYLMKHRHTSPFEMCEIKIHVKAPLFVVQQWLRHRTWSFNQISHRYSESECEFYVPAAETVKAQSTANKQGSDGSLEPWRVEEILNSIKNANSYAKLAYEQALSLGVSREIARIVLPASTYTEFYAKVDLHNLLHFLKLRTDVKAQYEIKVYADALDNFVQQWCPLAHAAWVEHVRDAQTFSASENVAVQHSNNGFWS